MSQISTENIQAVSFRLVNQKSGMEEYYAIPIEHVREIRNLGEITKIPKTKSFVNGIINLRGVIIPIVDIKDKLGIGKTILKKTNQRILVTEIENELYGLLIDEVDQVMVIEKKEIDVSLSDTFNSDNYIKGIVKTSTNLIVILNILQLLDESKRNNFSLNKSNKKLLQKDDKGKSQPIYSIPSSITEIELEKDDNIPEELKEVFQEDSSMKTTREHKPETNNKVTPSLKENEADKYQNKVKRETERMKSDHF